ncbi:MAG: DUF378 domain-containing protein [Patescibacteria group bacterium]
MLAVTLVWVGALNWGLVGLFGYNLVGSLLGAWPMLERVVYVLVGVSAVFELLNHKEACKLCGKK